METPNTCTEILTPAQEARAQRDRAICNDFAQMRATCAVKPWRIINRLASDYQMSAMQIFNIVRGGGVYTH